MPHCEIAAQGGLGPESTATAWTLLGLYVEPPGLEDEDLGEEGFERTQKAEAFYRKALATSAQSPLAAYRLGRLLARRLDAAEALVWLDRAATLRPDWAVVHAARVEVLLSLKRPDDAILVIEAAARAAPEGAAESLARAATIEEERGRHAEAIRLHVRAAAADPQDFGVCLELGRSLINSGHQAEATPVLLTAFANRQGQNGDYLTALASWLRAAKRLDEALAAAQEAAAAEPDSPHVLRELAFALRARGRVADAQATYAHWRVVAPRDYTALWDEGQALEEAGRLGEAITVYQTFYQQFPAGRESAARLLGYALTKAGRYAEAIPFLKEAGDVAAAEALEEKAGRPEPPKEER